MTPKQKRTEIKRILSKLTGKTHSTFMHVYSPLEPDKDINLVIAGIPVRELSWVLVKLQILYYKIFEILKSV